MKAHCAWCGGALAKGAPSSARFCRDAHRSAFHSALRRFGERMFSEGAVTIEQLRSETPCTARGETK